MGLVLFQTGMTDPWWIGYGPLHYNAEDVGTHLVISVKEEKVTKEVRHQQDVHLQEGNMDQIVIAIVCGKLQHILMQELSSFKVHDEGTGTASQN